MVTGTISFDEQLVDEIAAQLTMRTPVHEAFTNAALALSEDHEPLAPLVLDMATGVGKTYIIAGLVEYLRRMSVLNVVVVTPSSVVQDKTVDNFTPGNPKFIEGLSGDYSIITPASYDLWKPDPDEMQLFVLNVQQLIRPTTRGDDTKGTSQGSAQRAARKPNEFNGVVIDYLARQKDLVVIADEHHLYSVSAKAFREGISDLQPAGIIGLTASASRDDDVIYRYPLKDAIRDGYVKRPVIAFRRGGYGEHAEVQQLRDALAILAKKQEVYDAYCQTTSDGERVNAVLFVQCADVAHATQTTQLLRGPDFMDSQDKVLQVDNAHDDELTKSRLRTIDDPLSPVRVVVSVNKLREGWDAHNIAVMVTLRAMTSDVLTQQTLGRGLRLPFGKLTKNGHIDQLDILAHDSFARLLNREDVLASFGIDKLDTSRLAPAPAQGPTPEVNPAGDEDGVADERTDEEAAGGETAPAPVVVRPGGEGFIDRDSGTGVVIFGDDADIGGSLEQEERPKPVTVRVNERFAGETFGFPSTRIVHESQPAFRLSSIRDSDIKHAVVDVSDAGSVIRREGLVLGKGKITTEDLEDVSVEALPTTVLAVERAIAEAVYSMPAVPRTAQNLAEAKRIASRAVGQAHVATWSNKSQASVIKQIRGVVDKAARAYAGQAGVETRIEKVVLPVDTEYTLPLGEKVWERLPSKAESSQFVRNRHYGDWDRGLFTAAAFDAFTTEYKIAAMANRSTSVRWWKRIYDTDRATLAYSLRDTYRPDFVVHDTDGRYWIVEGKAERNHGDAEVLAKRDAAEKALHEVRDDDRFTGTEWGYIIVYESDVAAAESWEDLVAGPGTVLG